MTNRSNNDSLPACGGLPGREIRCECHRLLARLDGDMLELRCPRCKRSMTIDLTKVSHGNLPPESLNFR